MYELIIEKKVEKKFKKLIKKDLKQLKEINKKVKQISKNPYHFKPLKGDLFGSRRVHINKSFVLLYEIDEKNKIVKILDYSHHDEVYE